MKIPYFRAKEFQQDRYCEGFYITYPATSFSFCSDLNDSNPIGMLHCLVTYKTTSWGMENEPISTLVDPKTIQLVGFVEMGVESYAGKSLLEQLEPEELQPEVIEGDVIDASNLDPGLLTQLLGAIGGGITQTDEIVDESDAVVR